MYVDLFKQITRIDYPLFLDHQLSNDTKILFDDYEITIEKPFWCPETITIKCLSTGRVEVREEKLPKGKIAIKYTKSEGLRYVAKMFRPQFHESWRITLPKIRDFAKDFLYP